jgi:hypothetical protein
MSTPYRTGGETRNCKGCRYWSEMIAQAVGGGPVQAICLCPTSAARGTYMSGHRTCAQWASGHLGAVDDPRQDPTRYLKERTAS